MKRLRVILLIGASLAELCRCTGVTAQAKPAAGEWLDYGAGGFDIPPNRLVNTTPPRTVDLLAQALAANPVAPRRVELVRDLGKSGLATAAPYVIEATSDPEAAVRAEAARAAAVLGGDAVRPALQKLLPDEDPVVRREAVRAGAAIGDASIVTAGLKDSEESVFVAAASLATTTQQDAQIAARVPSLSPEARLMAIRALGRRADATHAPVVAAQLAAAELPLTVTAIDALARMKATSELEGVKRQLDHMHPTVRRAAVAAMSALAPADEQIAVARQALADADLSVREQSARLLAAHPSTDTVPTLLGQLSAGYPPLRQAARDAIVAAASVSPQPVIDAAIALIADSDPRRREDGSYVLGRLRSHAAFERHVQLLKDPDWLLVSQAADSLGRIGNPEAGPELEKIAARARQGGELQLTDAAQVQAVANAFIACGKLRYKPVLILAKAIVPQKRDYAVSIRAPAIWAAGAAGDSDDKELADMLLSVARDNSPYESEEARFEAIKAIGNMGYLPALESMRREAQESALPSLRWMSHVVADRLAGTTTPYTPPDIPFVANTSIQVLDR